VLVVLVTTERLVTSTRGMAYVPGAIIRVRYGRTDPMFGYAPPSWRMVRR